MLAGWKIILRIKMVLNKITDFKSMIDQTVSTVRRIAYELRPSMLDDMGLVAAIEWQLIELKKGLAYEQSIQE